MKHMLTVDGTDSWIEVSSQPSSSSLSSATDEIVTTGLRVQQPPATRRPRRLRPSAPSHLNVISRANSVGGTSSQEEYEESESESDQVMTSSNEGLAINMDRRRVNVGPAAQWTASDGTDDDDDDDGTAINYPINHNSCFTPQPNAFSHPPSSQGARHASQPVPGSYFPRTNERPTVRHSARHSYPSQQEMRAQHSPYNAISPSYNAAADHEAALRASLSTLLSCAAAARGLSKPKPAQTSAPRPASTRVEPSALRMVPESALAGTPPPAVAPFEEPAFHPTIRRASTSTSASAESRRVSSSKQEAKRKAANATGRNSSKDRRAVKKARRGVSGYDEFYVSPTLLTWVVSAGVVVVLSALSFSAGYSMGKEAGRLEVGVAGAGEASSCTREISRTGLGLRKLKFSSVAKSVGVGA